MQKTVRATLAGLILLGAPAQAADPADADWPCIQRKVEHLSIGVMWPHPIPEDAAPLPAELEELAARLALRRVPVDEARAIVTRLAAERPDLDLDDYGRIFLAAFERIDRQRSEIVAGIGRYAQNQARLAAEIGELRAEMTRLEVAEQPDFDRMDLIEEEIDWRVRIFEDRNRALTYVCESPVLLEQRAYAIAQLMLEAAA